MEDLANPFNEVHFYDENKQDTPNHFDNGMDFAPTMMIHDRSPEHYDFGMKHAELEEMENPFAAPILGLKTSSLVDSALLTRKIANV